MPFPHCDQRILHAPGECSYCDGHPEWQALRQAWQINFTGHDDAGNLLLCPADVARDPESYNAWGGNKATKTFPDVFGICNYQPTPLQSKFHSGAVQSLVWYAGRGAGKTTALIMDAARYCVEHDGVVALYWAPTTSQALSALEHAVSWLTPVLLGTRFSKGAQKMTFANGSILYFRRRAREGEPVLGLRSDAVFVDNTDGSDDFAMQLEFVLQYRDGYYREVREGPA